MRRRADDGAAIALQDFQPIADIVGVADSRHDAERRAKKGTADFRDQFFAGVSGRAEASGKVTIEATLSPGPMGQLMQRRAIEVDWLEKALLRRRVHRI